MVTVRELRQWLKDCEDNMDEALDDVGIFIDEGGLTLRLAYDLAELYLEVGGHSEDRG